MSEPIAEQPAPDTEHYVVRQRVTMMVNRYEIHCSDGTGAELGLLCFAEQKRMKLKEEVTFFSDAAKTHALFGFRARKVIDLGSGYDVLDANGEPIGWFKKNFGASLASSTWHLRDAAGLESTGSERNAKVAVLRRIWDVVPVVGDIPVPWLFHFDFRTPEGETVLSSTKRVGVRDVYHVDLPALADGRRLDWRVGAAMAVALDALQSR